MVPVGAARDIRRPRRTSVKGINVVKGGLCGVKSRGKKVMLAVVRNAVVDFFVIGHLFDLQTLGNVAKAAADVEAACSALACAQRSWAACAFLARAFRHRDEAEAHKVTDNVADLAATSAAMYKIPTAAKVATPERHNTPADDDQDAVNCRGPRATAPRTKTAGRPFLLVCDLFCTTTNVMFTLCHETLCELALCK